MNNNYVIYHLHTKLSNGVTNIDSITDYEEYVKTASELGMKAMAFSEHGSVFEWVKKKECIEKHGMKYIHGEEFYVTETVDEKIRDNYHCGLYARNYEGVKEINKLSSLSFDRHNGHYYYSPRITIDQLINTSSNVIVTTACLSGLLNKGTENIKDRFIKFLIDNKERCFLEVQHHNVEDQIKYNQYLYDLSKTTGVRLIAGTDTHALNDEHMKGRKLLQKSKNVNFANEDDWDLTFKSYDELVHCYKTQNSLPKEIYLEAIQNTNVLSDMVEEFTLDRSYKYPHLWENPMDTFKNKIAAGIKRRGVDKYPNYQEYLDRIEHELKAYIHNGAIDFMLLMENIINWCVENNIGVGYGRGSVNGSVIAWLLGITEMDSIKHKLNFERFMNVERVSLSDIDTDFPPSRINDVKQYIFSKTGLYCCDIVTFNTIADKGAIRDVGRALNISLDEVANICNCVDDEEEYKKVRNKYKELFEYVDLIKGTVVSVGNHPCGLVVSPQDVTYDFGTFTTSTDEYPISQIYMKEIDSLNYVKLDLLKLDTIELINEVCELAGIERVTPDNLDINDVNVWNSMRDDTTQIFQWEGKTGDDYIKKLLSDKNIESFKKVNENVDRMTLLSIGNSAIRPAGKSYREDLASGVVRTTGSKALDDFLAPTFGYLVFQCQIIDFLHQYCGFTMGEADIVRRHFAKKTGTEDDIPVIKDGGYMKNPDGTLKKDHYIDGFVKTMKDKYGMDKDESEKVIVNFLNVIIDASSYLFSLNHSQPYSYEGYASGWLRYYYPLEFLTEAMNINKDKEEKTVGLTNYAKKVGIKINNPKFGYSKSEYFCDKESNCIYKGIGSIKYMNENIANELYDLSQSNNYTSFTDLLFDVKQKTSVNSRQLDILIKLDFFADFGDINTLLRTVELYDIIATKKQIRKDNMPCSEELIRKHSKIETETEIKDIDFDLLMDKMKLTENDLANCVKYKYEKEIIMTDELEELFREIELYQDDEEYVFLLKNQIEEIAEYKKNKIANGYSIAKVLKKFDIPEDIVWQCAKKITYGKFSDIDSKSLIKDIISKEIISKCTLKQIISYQREFLGYIDTIDESYSWRYVVVTKLDTKYAPRFEAYCINNGKTQEMKIPKKKNYKDKSVKISFTELPIEDGDIIYIKDIKKKPRQRKDGDKWVVVPGEYNWWINDYSVVK